MDSRPPVCSGGVAMFDLALTVFRFVFDGNSMYFVPIAFVFCVCFFVAFLRKLFL